MTNSTCRKLVAVTYVLLFLLTACIETIDEVVAPSWSTNLNLPITEVNYSFSDLLENLSHSSQFHIDSSNSNIITFTKQFELDDLSLQDKLTIDDMSSNFVMPVGEIRVDNIDPLYRKVTLYEWLPELPPLPFMPIPMHESPMRMEFNEVSNLEFADVKSGLLEIVFRNTLSFDITLKGITILNQSDNSIIANGYSEENNWVKLLKGESKSISFALNSVTILKDVVYTGLIFTEGTGTNMVPIDNQMGVEAEAYFTELILNSFRANIDLRQKNELHERILIGDNLIVDEAIINQGKIELDLHNKSSLDYDIKIFTNQLVDINQAAFFKQIKLTPNSVKKITVDIAHYKLNRLTNGNSIDYTIESTTTTAERIVTVNSEDCVTAQLNISQIKLASFSGIMQPRTITVDDLQFQIDFSELNKEFTFNDLSLNTPKINLKLFSTFNCDLLYDALITPVGTHETKKFHINNLTIKQNSENNIDLESLGFSEYLNEFGSDLPNTFSFSGTIVVNPNTASINITGDEIISPRLEIEIPLDLYVSGGIYRDTLDIDLTEFSNQRDEISSYVFNLKMENEFPVNAEIEALFLDVKDNETYSLSKLASVSENENLLQLCTPRINSEGYVTKPGGSDFTFSITKEQFAEFKNSEKLAFEIKFESVQSTEQLSHVKFRSDYNLQMNLSAEIQYSVN